MGSIPDPESLAHYEQISPGFADRIIKMTENEGIHRREMEDKVVTKSFNLQNKGLWMGFSSVIVVSALSAYALYLGHPTQAATIAGTVIAALASVFVVGRFKQKKSE